MVASEAETAGAGTTRAGETNKEVEALVPYELSTSVTTHCTEYVVAIMPRELMVMVWDEELGTKDEAAIEGLMIHE